MAAVNKENVNILVADDESFVLNLTVRILNNLGYTNVDTASNGKIALGKLISKLVPDYSLIILDLDMPEMNGVEFMRHAHEINYEGGIILFSGHDQRILETALTIANAHNLNVLGAIPKPLKPHLLEELIHSFKPAAEKRHYVPQAWITEDELREGIEEIGNNELVLVYQPKIEIRSGEITGVETLARWKHPERGLLGPGTFIPLAEETGCINELTNLIYRRAVQQTADWLNDGIIVKTSVNFSIHSFSNSDFSEFIIRTTEEIGVDPNWLILEVTETQVMTNVVDSLEILMKMRFKKFGLSIDDFGTGSSSLAQLKTIPFTEMKIDRAFVHGAANNASARAILETSVDLAKRLEMKIVAEGAETKEDWDLVEQLECDYVQGFYCAKPMTNKAFLTFQEKWAGPH